jgi:hypothetical protein
VSGTGNALAPPAPAPIALPITEASTPTHRRTIMGITFKGASRLGAAAAITGAVVVGSACGSTGAAQAMPAEQGECSAKQLNVSVREEATPVANEKLFAIEFAAEPGVSCTLIGAPTNLIFYSAGGAPLGIESVEMDASTAASVVEVIVDEAHPKVVYVASPRADLPGATAAKATFDLPSDAVDTAVEVAWPSEVNGPVRVGNVGDPVS